MFGWSISFLLLKLFTTVVLFSVIGIFYKNLHQHLSEDIMSVKIIYNSCTVPIIGIFYKNLHQHLSEDIVSVKKPPSPY